MLLAGAAMETAFDRGNPNCRKWNNQKPFRPLGNPIHYSHSINLYRLSQRNSANFCELAKINKAPKTSFFHGFRGEKEMLQFVGKLFEFLVRFAGGFAGFPAGKRGKAGLFRKVCREFLCNLTDGEIY